LLQRRFDVDALYLFRHSVHGDVEIRYSLRSLAKFAPYIRKVWIFGDRPAFLSDDTSLIEHVPHSYITRSGSFRTPVTNFFLMLYLSSLIPDLDHEYLFFCDDFSLLRPSEINEARKVRYLQDLSLSVGKGTAAVGAVVGRGGLAARAVVPAGGVGDTGVGGGQCPGPAGRVLAGVTGGLDHVAAGVIDHLRLFEDRVTGHQ
jgi:hypothetical protein